VLAVTTALGILGAASAAARDCNDRYRERGSVVPCSLDGESGLTPKLLAMPPPPPPTPTPTRMASSDRGMALRASRIAQTAAPLNPRYSARNAALAPASEAERP
jgi:hypothetical protein